MTKPKEATYLSDVINEIRSYQQDYSLAIKADIYIPVQMAIEGNASENCRRCLAAAKKKMASDFRAWLDFNLN